MSQETDTRASVVIIGAPFSYTAGHYMRIIALRWLWRYGWMAALPLIGLAIASKYDLRLFVVALILALVAYPLAMCVAYMSYALKPVTIANTQMHHRECKSDGIYMEIDSEHKMDIPQPYCRYSDIARYEDSGRDILLIYKGNRLDGFVAMPTESLQPEQLEQLISHLRQYDITNG